MEKEISFSSGKYTLDGTLCMPDSTPCPAALLLAGSGPQNRDGAIGCNTPLKDIADYLEYNGIASFRYDKRMFKYKPDEHFHEMTVYEEVIGDAVTAISVMEDNPKISDIYIIGHSLGGWSTPLIAKYCNVSGICIMASNASPIDKAIVEQVRYQRSRMGIDSTRIEDEVQSIKSYFRNVRKGGAETDSCLMGAPTAYWRSLLKESPVNDATCLDCRILVLQGENDCQISMDEFRMWKEALRERAEFKSFPNLNHIFMKTEGRSTGMEYCIKSKVSDDVLETIVSWIKN